MNENKYIDIAKKLIEKNNTQTYTVISNSMRPLILKNDKILCIKPENANIQKYSLIAFHTGKELSRVATIHRVIKVFREKDSVYFRTKGDNNLCFDKDFVPFDQIIGVVHEILKKNYTLCLNKSYGRLISLSMYFFSNIKNFIKSAVLNFTGFFVCENKCEDKDNLLIVRQSLFTKIKDWNKIVSINTEIINPLINKDMSICDFSFGGGYCEESFCFIRRGFNIDYISNETDSNDTKKYDFIICSRVINIVSSAQKRMQIYRMLKSLVKPEGKILISYINEKNNFFIRTKRNILKLFSKKYQGPQPDDIVYQNLFVMKDISGNLLSQEMQNSGFCVLKKIKSGKINTFLISKKQ